MQSRMIERAKQLLADGTVNRVIGWKKGEFAYDITPAVFERLKKSTRISCMMISADTIFQNI